MSRVIVTIDLDDATYTALADLAKRHMISPETMLVYVLEQQYYRRRAGDADQTHAEPPTESAHGSSEAPQP